MFAGEIKGNKENEKSGKIDRKVLECYKILGRRFIFSFAVFSCSEYYIMRLSLYNTSQHRNNDMRLKVREQQMVVLMEDFSRL